MTRPCTQRIRLRLVGFFLAVLGLLLAGGPANAQRLQWSDKTGDVWLTNDSNGTTTAAPKAANGDIRRVTVRYHDKAVFVRTWFADLRRTGDSLGIKGDLRTSSGRTWHFAVAGRPHEWRGSADLVGPDFNPVSCRLSSRLDYTLNTARLRIPSSCLKQPRWVKVAFFSVHALFDDRRIYLDDALSAEVDRVVWSQRMHRG